MEGPSTVGASIGACDYEGLAFFDKDEPDGVKALPGVSFEPLDTDSGFKVKTRFHNP